MAYYKVTKKQSSPGPGPQPTTTLPYIPSEDEDNFPLTALELADIKDSIDAYNSNYSRTPVNWSTSNYVIFKTKVGTWYTYSDMIDVLAYKVYIYSNTSLTATWSTGTNFNNFEYDDVDKYFTIDGTQASEGYTLYKRTIGELYNGWSIESFSTGWQSDHQYFGAKTANHVENGYFDYYYYDNYPVFVNVPFETTDSQSVTQAFLKNGNYTLFACGTFTTGSTQYAKSEIDCGFQPDYVEVKMEFGNSYTYANAYMESRGEYGKSFWDLRPIEGNIYEIQLGSTEGETGISDITSTGFKYRVNGGNTQNKACTYKAIKF